MERQNLDAKTIETINKIANTRKTRDSFAYFAPQDIYQEIWTICLDGLKRYKKENGCLENFLNVHVSNRIKNLKRDKYFNKNSAKNKDRINIINALPIGDKEIEEDKTCLEKIDIYNNVEDKDTYLFILDNISDILKPYFQRLINGEKMKDVVLQKLKKEISEILNRE